MIWKSELKFIRSLKIKKYRTSEKCFLVEGEKNVLELLNGDYKIKRLLLTKEFLNRYEKNVSSVDYIEVTSKELVEVSSLVTNDTALAVVEMKTHSITELDLTTQLFVLDGIRDPGNLGTIVRTLDWFGFNQLILSMDSVELYNPKVINATMGSFARVKVVYLDLVKFISNYEGVKVGAEMSGDKISNYKNTLPCLIVMGSESHGISTSVRKLLDHKVSISRIGGAESLNVGVATGILCHELVAE